MSEYEHREHELEHCDGGNGEEDDEEDKEGEDGGDEGGGDGDREGRRKGVFGISRGFRSAIKRPFRKRKKAKEKGDGEIVKLKSARRRRRRIQWGGGGVGGCFLRRRSEESPESPTSDPNSERFSFEMLKSLIEKNDFYCKECNTHIR